MPKKDMKYLEKRSGVKEDLVFLRLQNPGNEGNRTATTIIVKKKEENVGSRAPKWRLKST
jgi:hypothetical protein